MMTPKPPLANPTFAAARDAGTDDASTAIADTAGPLLSDVPALPYGFAREGGALVVAQPGGLACVYRSDADLATLLEIQRRYGDLPWTAIDPASFDARLQLLYRANTSVAAGMAATDAVDLVTLADSAAAVDDLLDNRDDSPVIKLINALLLEAIREGASDIHVETQERRLIVRFRIDGVLREKIEPKRALAPLLVSRIKVMARLDIAEKRIPQDGRVSLRIGESEIDVRVSTMPTQHGERVVMRLLVRDTVKLETDSLGMNAQHSALLMRLLERPNGMLIVSGPTGSGKTTTLYAALNHLNDRRRNIMTVEDPIEYEMDGIAQTQVNVRTDMTFARGLRAILRQDPDVIMVGEIRDHETAVAAVRASMTGHFVLSTLHTNSAIGCVTRLIDIGVERYLLAPMLVGLVAQRLVRQLCAECRSQGTATAIDNSMLDHALVVGEVIWHAVGCSACHFEGYRGRTGLYEIVPIDRTLENLIHDGASEARLAEAAHALSPSLLDDGVAKVRLGQTTVQEVARVVREEA